MVTLLCKTINSFLLMKSILIEVRYDDGQSLESSNPVIERILCGFHVTR